MDISAVFHDGIRADHDEELLDEDETAEESDRLYRVVIFCDFIKCIPNINASLGSFEDDPAKLEDFINAVNTCKLKDLCPSYLLDDPSKPGAALDPPIVKGQSKSLRGWHHKSTARALCPMVDIKKFDEDPHIINGEKRPPSFKKLPSCLYDKSIADPKLKHVGFLCGKPLERTFRAIFTGPLTALDPTSRKGTKHPKGIIHSMTEPSAPAIAYAAIQLFVSLSSAEQWTSEVTGLDLYELYMSIVDSLKRTDHPWVKETLDYWTKFCLSPPPEQQQCPSPPPPEQQQRQPTPPQHSPQGSHHADEDEDKRLTPPPSTPPPVTKRKAAKCGKATRRKH
ncbi:hypothetical protein DEU56DRAFT_752464 [Suillus clintonianus]|uniref:uncharacterized protein n=1 Tax=Suillus clintonianus TaxID=1904413 RepID=UPI001B8754BE|nr:uncharacterized protein DEU56DRAFT_752464 [Suillus clintonianus]KAG2150798.1 hypothetical protein DEU56DRAFT_752464 [Suillus clintonianus]